MAQRTSRSLEARGRAAALPAAPRADEYIKGAIISLQRALIAYRCGRARDTMDELQDARRAVTNARLKLNDERGAR